MRAGDRIADRFEIAHEVGAGAMGVVWKAIDRLHAAPVAVKVLTALGQEHPARFAREASILEGLSHPGIVRHVAHGTTPEGEPYLVMEWLDGENLASRLQRAPSLSIEDSVAVVRLAAGAIGAAHRRGIVHRDVKPSNVFLVGGRIDDVRVLDFGIAADASAAASLTRTGLALGTPGYMAPEQARGRPRVDARADVFALGCVLFRCLAGRPPFAGEDVIGVLVDTVLEETPRVRHERPEVSDALDALVAEMLAKPPAARPRDADAVVARIDALPSLRREREKASRATDATRAEHRRNDNLPRTPTSFHGREADLDRLDALFRDGARLVTVLGTAGTGKTRLALRYGETVRAHPSGSFDGGVWFCDLTEATDVGAVTGAVARAIDTRPTELARSLKARGDALYLLDNCEQVVADVARAVAGWLEDAPRARFLATSRETLRVGGECVYTLGPLSLPRDAGDVDSSEAVRLFVDRANLVRRGYHVDEAAAPVVAEIVRQLDGLPLAIELAAARMGLLGERTILERLAHRFDLLAGSARDVSARQQTLRGAIEWSWQLLEPWERTALSQCSVFRGGFTLDAAEHVLDVSASPGAPAVLDVLQALHAKSLVRTDEAARDAGSVRFTLYESIREFAQEKLPSPSTVSERHAAYYVGTATAWAERASEHADIECSRRLECEAENLLAVHRRSLADPVAARRGDAARTMVALDPVLSARGQTDHHLALLDATLDGAGADADETLVGRVLVARARARMMRGALAAARDDAERAADAGRRHGDTWIEGRALGILGNLEGLENRTDESLARYVEARECLRRGGHTRWESAMLYNLSELRIATGSIDEAHDLLAEALEGFRRVGDRGGAALAQLPGAFVLQEKGRLDDAREQLERVLADTLRFYGVQRHAVCVGYLAGMHYEAGDTRAAHARYAEAIRLLRETGDRHHEGLFASAFGALVADDDRIDEARETFDRATEILEAVGAPSWLATLSVHRGHVDLAIARARAGAGDVNEAERNRAVALDRLRRARSSHAASGDFRFAVRMLERALAGGGPRRALVIGPDARWFHAPGGARVDIERARQVRRLLGVLVRRRLEAAGEPTSVEALLREGWPGERFAVARSGAMRVYMLLSKLRSLGLREVLRSAPDGYLLDAGVEVRIEGGQTKG